MSTVHRLRLIGAVFALGAAITCSHVWGDASGGRRPLQTNGGKDGAVGETKVGESLAAAKFAEQPVVSYRTAKGEIIFGAQIKPDLGTSRGLPRDVLVLIDTSASQAGTSYNLARQITKSLDGALNEDDQINIWTVNIPSATRSLTGGFRSPRTEKVKEALDKLETVEYASGVCDLKGALSRIVKEFDVREGRQPVLLLLGDGESAYNPIGNADRYQIAQEFVGQKVAFFAVPLGAKVNPMNLHGFASTTGGTVIRLQASEKPEETAARVLKTVSAPILYPSRFELASGTKEVYPSKLPPLRSDNPTLMVGRLSDGDVFGLTIEGTVAGKSVNITVRETIAKPEVDNYFLTGMVAQWSKAGNKAAPALIRADRALAYGYQQTQLTREEFLTQAHWALTEDRIAVAEKMFAMAQQIDPHGMEAASGLAVVKKLKEGGLTRNQLMAEVMASREKAIANDGNLQAKAERLDLNKLLVRAEQDPPAAGPGAGAPPAAADDAALLQQARQQQLLAEQQTAESVDRSVKNAKQLLNTDPDGAYNLLKRQMESVASSAGIGEKVRVRLVNQLEGQMRDFELRGRSIKLRLQEEEERRVVAAREAAAKEAEFRNVEKTRERIRAFTNLMDKARYEEAYKEANLLREESINNGQPVPIQATASYAISLNAMNLKELNELKRIREERFLLTMMQVEKSHVPYPDEPPVHFPPAAAWKELTKLRSKRYGYYSLGPRAGENYTRVVSRMNSPMRPGIEQATELPLGSWLEQFRSNLEGTNFYIRPNEESLKADPPVKLFGDESPRVKIPAMPGATLGSVMAQVLSALGLTYFINEDHVEIIKKVHAKKNVNHALRVYEVADLVIPIPSAINTFGVGQTLAVLGGAASFGSAGSPFNAFGNGGAIVGGLGGIGGIGGGIGGVGGIGGLAGLGGGIGGLGGGIGGGLAGAGGAQGIAGAGALGINGAGGAAGQGGLLGFGGGQQGQLGNLGGQFGFQGQTFENYLVRLIQDTIARGKWSRLPGYLQTGGTAPNPAAMDGEEDTTITPADEQYDMGFYPPALALVVRAPSHMRPYVKDPNAPTGGDGGGMGFRMFDNRGENRPQLIAKNDAGKKDPQAFAVVDQEKAREEYKNSKPRKYVTAKEWQEALAKSDIKPEHRRAMVIAATKFLGEVKEFSHAAEVLKGNLRLGYVNDDWVFGALTIALQESGGSPEDLERARLSCIDLGPKDPDAYLQAAKVMNESNQPERAVAFCKVAADLKPEMADPYANALAYAQKSKSVDSDTVHWAVSNLLGREWLMDKELYHSQARDAMNVARSRLLAENRKEDAAKIDSSIATQGRRDLVIELVWQDAADLDLTVFEPINTVCSATHRQTPAGSMLVCDDLKDRKETYTVAEAFNGTYVVKVNRVWGRPLGGKATLKVVRHQGSPDQSIEYHTVNVDQSTEIKVTLTNGRRNELAKVPPPFVVGNNADRSKIADNMARSIDRLRTLADPLYRNDMIARVGGVGAAGGKPSAVYDVAHTPKSSAMLSYETRLDVESMALEMTTRIEVSSSGDVRVKVSPAFDTVDTLKNRPAIDNPLIPGAK